MRRLVIETAGDACSIALFDADALVAWRHERVGRGHAERLVPMIAELGVVAVDELLVDVGPGSFTGVRVGLAAAIGLGLGWGVSVRGFSSLALVAATVAPQVAGDILVVNEGGHGQLFVQRFATGPLRPLTALASLDPAAVEPAGATLAGTAAARFPEALPAAFDARHVLALPEPLRTLDPTPRYGRPADARPMAA